MYRFELLQEAIFDPELVGESRYGRWPLDRAFWLEQSRAEMYGIETLKHKLKTLRGKQHRVARREYNFTTYMERLWKEGYSNEDIFDLYCPIVFEVIEEVKEIGCENLIFLNVKTFNKIGDMGEQERRSRLVLARLE